MKSTRYSKINITVSESAKYQETHTDRATRDSITSLVY